MMNLYFLRHGQAENIGDVNDHSDFKRRLTAFGREQIAFVGKGLQRLDVSFDQVISSPFLRAEETAEICLKEMGVKLEIEQSELITPGGTVEEFVGELYSRWSDYQNVLFVTHQPFVSSVISHLLALNSDGLSAAMAPGSLCHLQVEKPGFGEKAILKWHMSSDQFEGLIS